MDGVSSMNQEKIGNFIKNLRLENNMSQKDLADKIPINREAVSKWECGRTIPDSSTILCLSRIFGVSADEIMYGEYKVKENKKEFDNLSLQIYDDRNSIYKKLNKTSKFLLTTLILLVISILGFLIYYFFNSYDSVRIYTIESDHGEIYLTDGTITLTGENIYFRLGNFNGIDENDISKLVVYYNKDNEKKIVYQRTNAKDGLIKDYYGYNEYFEIEKKGLVFDKLCVDLYFNEEVKTLNLIIKEDYSNKRLFFRKNKKSASHSSQTSNSDPNELIKYIKEKFKYEKESEAYSYKKEIGDTTYDLIYMEDVDLLLISWEKEDYYYSIEYDPIFKIASYKKSDINLNYVDNCSYYESDDSTSTCDSSIIIILDSIIKEIVNKRS